MSYLQNLFTQLEFDFQKDLKPFYFNVESNLGLYNKLNGKVFRYIPENENTQTTLTIIDSDLSKNDELEIKKYLWNENKSDLYLINNETEITLNYTFTDPREIVRIETFLKTNVDSTIDKISKRNLDTGIFWEVFKEQLPLLKRKRFTVDKSLVETLRQLRHLLREIYNRTNISTDADLIVQALIDRTLFVKYLEDKGILSSIFYNHYFGDEKITYNLLLKTHHKDGVNKLFELINFIFNNSLFENPKIPNADLIEAALSLIAEALDRKDFATGQLSLFEYKFDVIPVEFIGHVYEMFFDDTKAEQGIYYTPEGLAKLIINSVIENVGRILDPACGSGMFLVIGLRKLFEKENVLNSDELINVTKRNKILSDFIYGIEKQENARRLTILSLYLELLNGISIDELKRFILNRIKNKEDIKLFPYDFTKNIIQDNALEVESINGVKEFDYVVGNPPFHLIKQDDEEESFWKRFKKHVSNRQISQCFFIKVKSFGNEKTKYGMVSNLSNFDSDQSKFFQDFFFKNFRITSFYNLTDIKNILFDNAKESVCVLIFDNNLIGRNFVKYIAPELTNFSKNFRVVLLHEDRTIQINQDKLANRQVSLRDFFVGDYNDINLIESLSKNDSLYKYLKPKEDFTYVYNGMQLIGSDNVHKFFALKNWKNLSESKKEEYKKKFIELHSSESPNNKHIIPFIKPENISPFKIKKSSLFLSSNLNDYKDIFERIRSSSYYLGDKVLVSRVGKLKAAFSSENLYYSFDVYAIKPKNKDHLLLFTALLNSYLVEYYILVKHKKRIGDSYPKITMDDLIDIPIPFEFNQEKIKLITNLSSQIFSGNFSFAEKKEELNDIIFDLYNLDLVSRLRIKDFFEPDIPVTKDDLNVYIQTYVSIVSTHLENFIKINYALYFDKKFKSSLVGVRFSFINDTLKHESVPLQNIVDFNLIELSKEIGNQNIYTIQEKSYHLNNIYIVKENSRKKWTKTRAIEDAKEFLNKF